MKSIMIVLCAVWAIYTVTAQDCNLKTSGYRPTQVYQMTPADIKAIVDYHNYEKGHMDVKADDQTLYTYSEALATTAMGWAKQCLWEHTDQCYRSHIGSFDYVGENLAAGSTGSYDPNPASPMDGGIGILMRGWAEEKVDFHWNSNSCNPGKMCGHYTQMVWSKSIAVGCAMTLCPSGTVFDDFDSWYLVCHYGPGGNMWGQLPARIATSGPCTYLDCGKTGVCNNGKCITSGGSPPPPPPPKTDPCFGKTCSGRGTCSQGTCNCQAGWTGTDCGTQVRIPNPCDNSPCLRGTCSSSGQSYTCDCSNTGGYTGQNCEVPPPQSSASRCKPNPCQNSGACSRSGNSIVCTCVNGFTGQLCEVPPKTTKSDTPSTKFLKRFYQKINERRSANGMNQIPWSRNLENDAASRANNCQDMGDAKSQLVGLCGTVNPEDLNDDEGYADWLGDSDDVTFYLDPNYLSIGCSGNTQGNCDNICGEPAITLVCSFTTSNGNFKVSGMGPMDYGKVKLGQSKRMYRPQSRIFVLIGGAVAGLVATVVVVALVVRRRRMIVAAPNAESLVVQEQL